MMSDIHFYLSSTADPINSNHPLWDQPLPRRRTGPHRAKSAATVSTESDILYKDYFSAIAAFCTSDNGARDVAAGATHCLGRSVTPDEISGIWIFLEKHGAFYHPARLQVSISGQELFLVVNVAVSDHGRTTLPSEMQALSWLHDNRPFGWVPDVYGHTVQTLSNGRELPLFLGTWFDGYHEFHLTEPEHGQDLSITIWDRAETPTHLSEDQTAVIYRKAAMILSACYDPVTTEQIFPWHHAAGDFVVKITDTDVSVRLITARGRTPVLALPHEKNRNETDILPNILEGLMFFLIHLTFRMRLDRQDGVGPVVLAPDSVVLPVMAGFFQGLDLAARLSGLPDDFPDFFRQWFLRHSEKALDRIGQATLETFFPENSEERQLVVRCRKSHLAQVRHLMTTGQPDFQQKNGKTQFQGKEGEKINGSAPC